MNISNKSIAIDCGIPSPLATTRKFTELENKMSPESRARSDAIYRQLLTELTPLPPSS